MVQRADPAGQSCILGLRPSRSIRRTMLLSDARTAPRVEPPAAKISCGTRLSPEPPHSHLAHTLAMHLRRVSAKRTSTGARKTMHSSGIYSPPQFAIAHPFRRGWHVR